MGEGLGYFPSSGGGLDIHGFEGEDFDGGVLRSAIIKLG
jgi:hypothetical protein